MLLLNLAPSSDMKSWVFCQDASRVSIGILQICTTIRANKPTMEGGGGVKAKQKGKKRNRKKEEEKTYNRLVLDPVCLLPG
jgi:hypothetical protein